MPVSLSEYKPSKGSDFVCLDHWGKSMVRNNSRHIVAAKEVFGQWNGVLSSQRTGRYCLGWWWWRKRTCFKVLSGAKLAQFTKNQVGTKGRKWDSRHSSRVHLFSGMGGSKVAAEWRRMGVRPAMGMLPSHILYSHAGILSSPSKLRRREWVCTGK